MLGDTENKQENSQGSMGFQGPNMTINNGLSYTEVKQLVLDLWKANALEYSQQAAELTLVRVKEFSDDFLLRLHEREAELLSKLKEPGMQSALYFAQADYAKSGDKDMFDLLIELLIDRAEQESRGLIQIVLDESLKVVSKLTDEHLDYMSLLFVLKHLDIDIKYDSSGLDLFIETYIRPFISKLETKSSCVNHIQYSNCASFVGDDARMSGSHFASLISSKYPIFFRGGFSVMEFESKCGALNSYPSELFTPYIYDEKLLQFNYTDTDYFYKNVRKIATEYAATERQKQEKRQILATYNNEKEISGAGAQKLLMNRYPYLESFVSEEITMNYKPWFMRLTSVGLAVAQAKFKRKTGISTPLSNWIS